MQKTVPARLAFRQRLFLLTTGLLATLLLVAGADPVRAAGADRQMFPKSIKPMKEAQRAAAVTNAAVDAAATVDFQVTLRMRNFAKLQARLATGNRPSAKEMTDLYFPLPADYQAVVAWAKAQGLTVLNNDAHHVSIRLRGQVATVERVLATKYAHVTVEGKDFLAAQAVPSLPASVASPVLGLTGLQPYMKARYRPLSTVIKGAIPYIPTDIMNAYNASGLTDVNGSPLSGAGQTIAILIDTVPSDDDLTQFWSDTGTPQSLSNITEINVNDVTPLPDPSGEETLDVSWTSGIAYQAHINVYAVGSLYFTDLDQGFQRMIDDTEPGTGTTLNELSISLGLGEQDISPDEVATESQYLATLASRGTSIFVSTGDTGSDPDLDGVLQASYPSSDPSVTAVGGTSLQFNINTQVTGLEFIWNNQDGAGGGGTSIFFQSPLYQSGNYILDQNGNVPTMRMVPDVCSAADPETGCYLVLGGKESQFGGTSWSAPTWAGFCAIINQSREAAGLPDVGLLNPSIYPLVGTANFRDIVLGNNYIPTDLAPVGPYNAVTGYDQASGIGAPVVSQLVATLTNTAAISVTQFTPQTGVPGTQVTVAGSGLDRAVTVAFNGTSAAFTPVSGVQLIATVPDGATTGPITVTDRNGALGTSATPFTVLPIDAGANDNFANAQLINPGQSRLVGSNVGATKEAGEPDHAGNPGGASIWYKWVAPNTSTYTFNTIGSSFDTLLAVYTGDGVTDLTEVASDDDFGTSVQSSVVFDTTFGTTYYIAVDGARQASGQAAQGTVVLNEVPDGDVPVLNDFSPTTGSVGQTVRLFGANFLTVSGVQFNNTDAAFRIDSPTQITTTVPAGATTGPISLTDTNDDFTSSESYFTVVPSPVNDNFVNATPVTGASVALTGTNVGATKEAGEPNHAGNIGGSSVWFDWTAPSTHAVSINTVGSDLDTLLAVYTGAAVNALTPVASNDDNGGPEGASGVIFNAVAGTVYRIAIDGYNGAVGNYHFNIAQVSGTPVITSFTPTSGGAGTTVVLTGAGFLTTTRVQFNGTAAPSFTVDGDTQLVVTAPNGVSSGPITVTGLDGTGTSATSFSVIAPPANDNFGNSQLLSGAAPLSVPGYTSGATKEAGEPDIIAGDAGGHSIWYTWTPPTSGDYVISTRGSDFDTLLGIYTGSTVASLTPVAANDDDPEGGLTSAITLTAVRGTTYRIVVDGSNGEAGNVVLSINNATAALNLYVTGFEAAEGFSLKQPLVGQNGWVSLDGVTGGNGLLSGNIPNQGQQAFVGNAPLVNGGASLQVFQPLNYTFQPLNFFTTTNYPVVTFTTLVRFTNSTNGHHDRFGFTASSGFDDTSYSEALGRYFSVVFDEATGMVSYQLNDGSTPTVTSTTFSNDVTYSLAIMMDFQHNLWTASLSGVNFVLNQPISATATLTPFTLTRISADWNVATPATPGDNYMAFDQYTVNAPESSAPAITVQPASQTVTVGQPVSFSVVAVGTSPLQYQWLYNGNAIPGATASSYAIATVNPSASGRYTVIVTNNYGSARSLDAFLVVSTTQPPSTSTVQVNPGTAQVTASSGQSDSVLFVRTGDLSQAVAVNYVLQGTAENGVDYNQLSGRFTFKAGQATKRLHIIPIDRGYRDGSTVLIGVKVRSGDGYTVGTPKKQKVTIVRD